MDDFKKELRLRIEQQLPETVSALLEERGELQEVPAEPQEQWELFRALVNTRPPMSASGELLAKQDALLQDILALRGTIRLEDISAVYGSIRLWRGDITILATDAIVNAANSQMLGCFIPGHYCIDNAIHTFAGMQLRIECARLMREQGFPEPTGMAKATDAFNLPSKYVIHTVGPIAQGCISDTDRKLLANCYTACLDTAADLGCHSIAFCCISTGVFGFPKEEAARIAIFTVREWLAEHSEDMAVVFNVFSEPDETLYRSLLET